MSSESARRGRKTLRGFSLLEVVAAATVMMVAFAGPMGALAAGRAVQEHQRRMTVALQIAEMQVESGLLIYPGAPDLAAGTHNGDPYRFDASGNPVTAGGDFLSTYTISPAPAGVQGFNVSVTVAWTEGGSARNYTLWTRRI